MTRARLKWVLLGAVLVWAWVAVPLALGRKTLFVRDVFAVHFPLKAFGAQQLAEGRIPALMPSWGLGQPFRGNPQALAFYPGNALYVLLPFWSAFNLHYMLHWLLALFTMRALARELGQGDAGALMSGLSYAGGGVVVSALSFYNVLTVLSWWPLAMLGALRGGRRGLALGGLACGLALLGGEPVTAALAMAPLLLATVQRRGWGRGLASAALVGALGLLVALPQVVATLRVLPYSFRGGHGVEAQGAANYSVHPLRALELAVPLPFGWPAQGGPRGYWAKQITPRVPFFYSLYFGVVGLWLAAWAARAHRRWTALAAAGFACAWLGGLSGETLAALSGGLFRYPEKFVVWLALAGALLAGFGLDRLAASDRRDRAARSALWAGAAALALAAVVVSVRTWWLAEASAPFQSLMAVQGARMGWYLAIGGALLAAAAVALRRGSTTTLVALQLLALLQLWPVPPRMPTELFSRKPALLAGVAVPATVHSPLWTDPRWHPQDPMPFTPPDISAALDAVPGIQYGLSYPFGADFEGMSFAQHTFLQRNLAGFDWARRLRWSRALGVEYLVVFRDLDSPLVELVARQAGQGFLARLYRVRDPAPRAWWPRSLVAVDGPVAALVAVTRAEDPVADVFAPSSTPQTLGGSVELLREDPDRLTLAVDSGGGTAVVRRAYAPMWRARAGSVALGVVPVNVGLVGVEVPAGRHQVELEVSRWPEVLGGAVALLAAAGLVWWWRRG